MSLRCPRCGLFNPDTALRCDCGYDFSTRTVQASYVERAAEAKHGGRANLLRARSRDNLRYGLLLTGGSAALTVILTAVKGGPTIFLPWALVAGIVLTLRGWRQRKDAEALERGGRPSPAPSGPHSHGR